MKTNKPGVYSLYDATLEDRVFECVKQKRPTLTKSVPLEQDINLLDWCITKIQDQMKIAIPDAAPRDLPPSDVAAAAGAANPIRVAFHSLLASNDDDIFPSSVVANVSAKKR